MKKLIRKNTTKKQFGFELFVKKVVFLPLVVKKAIIKNGEFMDELIYAKFNDRFLGK